MAAPWLYRCAWTAALAVASPYLLARTIRRPREMRERRGLWTPLPAGLPGGVWVHAASVGEARAARALLGALRARGIPVLLSVVTPAARALEAEFLAAGASAVRHAPLDVGRFTRRALGAARPRALLLIETEIWPALLGEAARAAVPVAFVSARLTERGAGRLAPMRRLLRESLVRVRVGAQAESDARRWEALGVPAANIRVTGNLKYDRLGPALDASARAAARGGWRRIAVFGSVREMEIDAVARAIDACRALPGPVLFVVAPRHPEKTMARLRRALTPEGPLLERTRREGELLPPAPPDGKHAILILATIGELQACYRLADAVFVGGTLTPIGGHNLFEAAECAVPVAFGPHVANVADVAEALLVTGGGCRVDDARSLADVLLRWLRDDAARRAAAAGAREAAGRLGGSLARTIDALEAWGVPLSASRTERACEAEATP